MKFHDKDEIRTMLESYILSSISQLDYRAFKMILLRKYPVLSRLGRLAPKVRKGKMRKGI